MIKSVVREQRRRAGIPPGEVDNALAGFTLGILRLHAIRAEKTDCEDYRGISAAQYEAGEEWARLCRWHRTVVCEAPRAAAPVMERGTGGLSTAPDPDAREVAWRRARWRAAYDALMGVCREHGLRARDVADGVCVENWPAHWLHAEDYGLLRYALNAIAGALRGCSIRFVE